MFQMFQKRPQHQQPLPSKPIDYPTGLAVETESEVFFIKGNTKFKYYSQRVFKSWNLVPAKGTSLSVSRFTYGGVLGFRDGTLINNIADGKIYLVSGNKRRHIQSPDVFGRYGLDESKIIRVSAEETNLQEEGEPLV